MGLKHSMNLRGADMVVKEFEGGKLGVRTNMVNTSI